MEEWEQAGLRHAEARALAPSLVGLGVEEATARAQRAGLRTQVVGHVVTTELALGRIRLTVDPAGTVTEAHAG